MSQPIKTEDIEIFFTDKVNDDQRKQFLLDLNERGITPNDIASFVKFLLPKNFPNLTGAIDICGTGGSGLPRINTSTISTFILASCGIKIAKHGNRAASGRFGSFDLLEKLGLNIELTGEQIKENFEQENLAFIFAQKFFPAMRYFGKVRTELKVPTIFNLLGPLLNPAQVKKQIIGTNSFKKAKLIVQSAKLIGKEHVISLVGNDHLDEVTITGPTKCIEMKKGEIKDFEVNPEDFGLKKVKFETIAGGDSEFNTKITKDILAGKCNSEHKNLVLANVAFTLVFMNKARDYKEGMKIAQEKIDKGEALKKLEKMMAEF